MPRSPRYVAPEPRTPMPTVARTKSASSARNAKKPAGQRPRQPAKARRPAALGALPEWNLTDLYPAMDAPELKRDLARADAECQAFETAYKGKLGDLAALPGGGAKLAEVLRRYEALDDLLGRIISYAGLVHAGNTVDPVRAKFYGDIQEKITAASLH